ncbi:MAG: hypothetical protein INQ03_12310 [Candidatus Heimdallarchaeota archaeon]|nr:hypothetical protein [Candidatus Heimdallarchaeota archaeon]
MSNELSQKEFAQLLLDNRLMGVGSTNLNDIISNPEFQVLKLLTNFSELSDSEIEEKYQAPFSLSMILSNLSADQLVMQTGSYKWCLSPKIRQLIDDYKISSKEMAEVLELQAEQQKENEIIQTKRAKYKRIVDALGKSNYVPAMYGSIEELFGIAELELLVIINQYQPISSTELEKHYSNENSLSLTLSNLKADSLIAEDMSYNWILEPKFKEKVDSIHEISIPVSQDADDGSKEVEALSSKINFVEHSQFLKYLLDINYFQNKSLHEIIETPEFKLLNVIYLKAPISQEEMEVELSDVYSFSMMLSNLQIDGLIEQDNDYRWKLSPTFRRSMSKIRIEQDEFMEEIKMLEKAGKPKISEPEKVLEPPSEYTPPVEDRSKTPIKKVVSAKDAIQDVLIKHRYIKAKVINESELMEIPEYEVLTTIAKYKEISSEDIEKEVKTVTLSLTLSNLQADGLIEQTDTYKWRVTESLQQMLDPSLVKSEVEKEREEMERLRVEEEKIRAEHQKKQQKEINKLAIACKKKGYLNNPNVKLDELIRTSEFEVLYLVQSNNGLTADEIKSKATSVSPVLISRTLSKLEADECLEIGSSFKYVFSEAFKHLIIEDELREQQEKEEAAAKAAEEAKQERLREIQDQMMYLADILINDGYISVESREPKVLMEIPDFEIIAILNKEGPLSIDQLKLKTESVSPVLISRTINSLEANNLIQRSSGDILDLSDMLKEKISSV